MDSILNNVKKVLGLPIAETHFDADIITHVNSVFGILRQLGVGPVEGYSIESDDEEWSDYIEDMSLLEIVKSYIPIKVKMLFDPPQNGTLVNAYEAKIAEYEWRLNATADHGEGGGVFPGGTHNYEELENLPSINSITLIGNKNLPELDVKFLTNTEILEAWRRV